MMKLFRKYMKHMLTVAMVLLLIVWLGGDALQSMVGDRDTSNDVIGQAFGKEVRQKELARIRNQSAIGERLVRTWDRPWFSAVLHLGLDEQILQYVIYQMRQQPLSTDEWYVLDAEARRENVHIPAEQVEMMKTALSPEMLTMIRDRERLSVEQIDQTLRAYLRVVEAAVQAANSVSVSEADIQDYVRQALERVKADFLVIDPGKLVDNDYQPTPDELLAHFEQYKDVPGGPNPGDFGYQMPAATQVEYIEVSVEAIASVQSVSLDEAYAYWTSHKNEFKKPATQPATGPAATRPETPQAYETFYEARADVIKKLQHEKAARIGLRLAEDIAKNLHKPWVEQPATQPGGYKEPPASEVAADLYEKTIAATQTNRYHSALSYGRTVLGTEEELAQNPKLSRAQAFANSSSPISFQQVAFMVAVLEPEKSKDAGVESLYRNIFETSAEVLTDSDGNAYVFRNIAVRPAQAPASYEPIVDKIIQDVRYARAVVEAEKQANAILEQARKSSLQAYAQSPEFPLASAQFLQPEPFSRRSGINDPAIGYDPELTEMCFNMAGRATATQPTPIDVYERRRGGKRFVIQVQELLPVTQEEYNQMRQMAYRQLLAQRRFMFLMAWFSHEEIMARTGWQDAEANREAQQAKAGT